ncbi:CaiB/BaiF CoA transferase family protein [Arvimicrobium flavum]|uniref:CaiB/BaiF CoA transferase family protein n=1 Tax=Arvimicrobium flavum TaxID=3393320 RepID=UPI00237A4034|nr:CoA transferase [Mesorhizobium shangrilense]
MTKLLSGVRVLDFSRVLAGPFCTALMADMGADIIKVEPPTGDDQRSMGAFRDGVSVSFELINRNKRSLKLDLKSDEGRDIARRLAAQCDAVVENFRPGVAAKLGIDYESLRQLRPDLIYCSISGFGQSGPLAGSPSYDVVAQALSGLMSITGSPEGEPMLVGDSVGDTVSGLFAAWSISSALYRRQSTGEGARLDVAMFDSLFTLLPTALAQWQVTRVAPGREGNQHPLSAPFGAYAAADGNFILAIANNALFRRFAVAIERPAMAEDARFSSDQQRRLNRDALRAEIETWSRQKSAADVVECLGAAGIPASMIWNVAEAADSAHADHRKLMTTVAHPSLGSLRLPEQPVHIHGQERGALRAAPALGGDGPAILSELLGTTPDEIAALRAADVI